NPNGNGNVVAARAEGNTIGNNADLDEIEEVNANVYDSDGSAEVHNYDNCYDNEIFNMFTQEEQYTELLCNTPKMGRSGIRIRGMLLQDQ
ncbi:hypothetical protein Tco_0283276, partial [Tanacetum coccineum]